MNRALPLLAAVLATLASPCNPEPTPRTLTLRLRLAPSCGATAVSYDLGCLVALETRATRVGGASGGLGSRCTAPPPGNPQSLGDLLKTAGQELLNDIDISRPLYLEVRGYHGRNAPAAAPQEVCQGGHVADWLLWGKSAPVAVGGDAEVEVLLECRAGCDCARLGSPGCPAAFPASACVPVKPCDQACGGDGDCFGGALACAAGSDGGRSACAPRGEGLCAACAGPDGCRGGPCVVDAFHPLFADGGLLGRCGVGCPDHACPAGTKCVSLVNGSYQALP